MEKKLYLKFCGHTLCTMEHFTIVRTLVVEEDTWTISNKGGKFTSVDKFNFVPGVVFPKLTMSTDEEVLTELYDVFIESIYEDDYVTRVTFKASKEKPLYLGSK